MSDEIDSTTEQWKPMTGYEESYSISNLGNVKSNRDGALPRKFSTDRKGYKRINLWKGGKEKTIRIHRLVMVSFIGICDGKPQVNHKNGVKTDNRLENLEWVTNQENQLHSWVVLGKKGNAGEINGSAKLTSTIVLKMRSMFDSGIRIRDIAKAFNTNRHTTADVVHRRNWRHIP